MAETEFAMTAAHACVLAWFDRNGVAPAEDTAGALGLPVVIVEALCLDLVAAGLLEQAPRH